MPLRTVGPLLSIVAIVALSACADGASSSGDSAAYLTLLGDDTLVVEWMEFDANRVEASALIRGSETTWNEYVLETDDAGVITTWESRTWAGGAPNDDLLMHVHVEHTDSGAMLVTTTASGQAYSTRVRPFDAEAGQVPFVDFLHWPFEFAFRRAAAAGTLGEGVRTLSGVFEMEANDDGSWALIHPSRGPSTVEIAEDGAIVALDGTGSTRAYDLRRMAYDDLDREAIGATFGDRPRGTGPR